MPISILLSYADLVRIGVVNNRTQLSRLTKGQDFPVGFLISANARRWQEEEVDEWIELRRKGVSGGLGAEIDANQGV